MKPENILLAVICGLCAAVFWGIGVWAAYRRDPMHFWSGSTVSAAEFRDVPAYNRANARMWKAYGAAWAGTGVLALYAAAWAGVLAFAAGFGGLFVLIAVYRRIFRKYKR